MQGNLDARDRNHDAASSSQGWQKDAVQDEGTRKLQEHMNFPEACTSTRKLVASGNSETEGSDKISPHHLPKSTNYVPHMEKVFSMTEIWSRSGKSNEASPCEHSYMAYLSIFIIQAAEHVSKDCTENLRSTKNQLKIFF